MKLFTLLLMLFLFQNSFSQLKELRPSALTPLDLSAEGEQQFEQDLKACEKVWEKMSDSLRYEDLSEDDKRTLSKIDESMGGYWDILGSGCSWYCGGGPKKVSASSNLSSQGSNSYEAVNAHDLDYRNAWVEGAEGYGIGEYLLYTFDGASPRITEIIVVNGYVKNSSAWRNNSRVKQLKVYIDDVPYAILNLEDSRSAQHFEVDPIGFFDRQDQEAMERNPDWTLKFEIMGVYEGDRYDDVVISEIYFDGIDVH